MREKNLVETLVTPGEREGGGGITKAHTCMELGRIHTHTHTQIYKASNMLVG